MSVVEFINACIIASRSQENCDQGHLIQSDVVDIESPLEEHAIIDGFLLGLGG